MTAHRRIQVTIQTDRVVTIRKRANVRLLCPECGCDVDAVDLAQVEALMGKPPPPVRNGGDTNPWHCLEGPGGKVLICLESLLKAL